MSLISKTTFTFTVLHRTDEPFTDSEFDNPYDSPLGEAMQRAFDGNAVGAEEITSTVEVPDEQVSAELVALGNDGEFFAEDLREEKP